MSLDDAKEMVDGLLAALKTQESVVVKSLHVYSKQFPSKVKRLFDKEKYAEESHRLKRLGKITPRWIKRKAKAGMSTQRGHATNQSSRAIGDKRAIQKQDKGFEYDVAKPASRYVADYRKVGGKLVRVSEYLAHYRNAKAPGFPSFSKNQIDEMIDGEAQASIDHYNAAMNGVAARLLQVKGKRNTKQVFRVRIEQEVLPPWENRL